MPLFLGEAPPATLVPPASPRTHPIVFPVEKKIKKRPRINKNRSTTRERKGHTYQLCNLNNKICQSGGGGGVLTLLHTVVTC